MGNTEHACCICRSSHLQITENLFKVVQHNQLEVFGLLYIAFTEYLQVSTDILLNIQSSVAFARMSASGPLTASTKPSFTGTYGPSHKDTARLSPPPLAPLLYLQTHRRGSITDPSLHAAPMNSSITLNTNYRQLPFDQLGSASSGPSSAHHDSSPRNHLSDPRPASPYVFGDATPHVADNSPQIRNLLRSPSVERQNNHRSSSVLSHEANQISTEGTSSSSGGYSTSLCSLVNIPLPK